MSKPGAHAQVTTHMPDEAPHRRLFHQTVRRAVPDEGPILRALRLEALAEAPDAFSSTLEREARRTPADWQRWLATGATFILVADDNPKGLVTGVPSEDGLTVWLMAMWLHPALRGSGASQALVGALITWAETTDAAHIRLHVKASNARARSFYERVGFTAEAGETGEVPTGCDLQMKLRLPTDPSRDSRRRIGHQ